MSNFLKIEKYVNFIADRKELFILSNEEIEARNAVIEEHNQLQEELSRLSNSNDLLTFQEWQKNQERKQSIMIEIDRLRAIESTWNSDAKNLDLNLSLQMLTMKDVQNILNCSYENLRNFIEIGMLHPIKTGKNFMFVQEDIYNFQKKYMGYDVSNYDKALLVYSEVNK